MVPEHNFFLYNLFSMVYILDQLLDIESIFNLLSSYRYSSLCYSYHLQMRLGLFSKKSLFA